MQFVVRIPRSIESLQQGLEALAGSDCWAGIETSAAILDQEQGWEDLLDAFELPLLSVHNLLPAGVSRYLAEAGEVARHALLSYVRVLLEKAAAAGIEYTSIDLGATREERTDEARVTVRVQILRSLMPLAEGLEIGVCLPRRLPTHQGRDEADATLRLLNDVSHRCCRLALDVYPDEVGPSFEIRDFLRSLHLHTGVIRWHYEPHLGIRLRPDFIESWIDALTWLGYQGPIILCPRHLDADALRGECARLRLLLKDIGR